MTWGAGIAGGGGKECCSLERSKEKEVAYDVATSSALVPPFGFILSPYSP